MKLRNVDCALMSLSVGEHGCRSCEIELRLPAGVCRTWESPDPGSTRRMPPIRCAEGTEEELG